MSGLSSDKSGSPDAGAAGNCSQGSVFPPQGAPSIPHAANGKGADGMAPGFREMPQARFVKLRVKPKFKPGPVYGAIDLGTNNCRLIVVRPGQRGVTVLDTFSRIVRLGEGVSSTGALSPAAMDRAVEALKVCAGRLERWHVTRARFIATEACRVASNSGEFLDRVFRETGLQLEVISREHEARLAVAGCASLLDRRSQWALVFDIGGGSTELIWLNLSRLKKARLQSPRQRMRILDCIADWISLPVGVVTLAEEFGGRDVDEALFERMTARLGEYLTAFEKRTRISSRIRNGGTHFIGTSGTVTTIAGVHLGLPHYSRGKVDGTWLRTGEIRAVSRRLLDMGYANRVAEPCIGVERADLVLAGCAILEALLRAWPCDRLRVADRGLRDGVLAKLMAEDAGHDGWPAASGGRKPVRQNSQP